MSELRRETLNMKSMPSSILINWASSIRTLESKSLSKIIDKLEASGFTTLEELLWILPLSIYHIPKVSSFANARCGELFKGEGEVLAIQAKPNPWVNGKRGIMLFTMTCQVRDNFSSQLMTLKWFNVYPSLKKKIEATKRISFVGEVTIYQGQLQVANPEFNETPENNASSQPIHNSLIIRYPTVNGIKGGEIEKVINSIPLHLWTSTIHDIAELPIPLHLAFATVHGKIADWTKDKDQQAKQSLIFYEFYQEQLKIILRRYLGQAPSAAKFDVSDQYFEHVLSLFPFILTEDQVNVLRQIRKDLQLGKPMMRLVQGDVGCGKTAVAFAAAFMVIEQGAQVAVMCPTEALAMQHYIEAHTLFENHHRRAALLLGSTSKKDRFTILSDLVSGKIDIIFGTHSLIQENVQFNNLCLAIIDEQHKFGVRQRIRLTEKGNGTHSLIMTATPIPRSLSLTQFGDLDISIIKSMPQGRKGQKTRIVTPQTYEQFLSFFKTRLEMGEQAYVVVPAIEESDKQDLLALETMHLKLAQYFPEFSIETMHGRMSGEEKETALLKFKSGSAAILLATSVIEVGINNPNATIMTIMNPERFGLSSLHQLRGRVGRGDKVGFCFLVCDKTPSPESLHRLMIIERFTDGFIIAEEDLKIRGEGDLFGTGQSGAPQRKLANIVEHSDTLIQVRDIVETQWLNRSSDLLTKIEKMSHDPLILSTI